MQMPFPPPPRTLHAFDFNLFFGYHIFNSYINTPIICNCKSMGLLGYIFVFKIFHKLASHNADLLFKYIFIHSDLFQVLFDTLSSDGSDLTHISNFPFWSKVINVSKQYAKFDLKY